MVEVEALDVVVGVQVDGVLLQEPGVSQNERSSLTLRLPLAVVLYALTFISSLWLYRTYTLLSPLHGALVNCLPSTAIGVRLRLPFAFMTQLPCWNCMIPEGHVGSVGFATAR